MSDITVKQIIEQLERSGLLAPEVLREVRDQAARNPEASARKLVRWLVRNGHLSRFQAQELLAGRSAGPSSDEGVDELEPFDELDELPPIGPSTGLSGPPALPAMGQAGATPSGLDSLMQAAGLGSAMPPASGPLGLPGMPAKKKAHGSIREYKMLIGCTILAVLVLMAVTLGMLVNKGTGDEAFEAADKEFAAGHYPQAIAGYDVYLTKFPDHSQVSLARVRRGLSIMRRVVDGAKGQAWVQAQDECQQVIEEIRKEEKFSEARPDLAAMLHSIADGLTAYAKARPDADTVKRCRSAIEHVRNPQYVPANHRDERRLLTAEADLALVERGLKRGERLQEAVEAIKQHVEKGNTAAVYEVRKRLLKDYPDIASDAQLQEVTMLASEAERPTVKFVAEPRAAETKEVEGPAKTTLLTETKFSGAPPGAAGHVVVALAEGGAYALDAANGKVLWRRVVGQETTAPPQRLRRDPAADVLLIDSQRGELVCVTATEGKLKWRLPLPGLKIAPLVLRERIVVTTQAPGNKSRIYTVNSQTGATEGYIELPQPTSAPPVADRQEQYVYQLGTHTNLYIVSLANRECQGVIYLGHDAGSITAPPVLVGDQFMLIAENRFFEASVVRVLKLEEGGVKAMQRQEVRLDGHVHVPPPVSGRTVVVATDLGGVFLYDITPANEKEPLVKGPQKSATLKQRHLTYVHVILPRIWAANNQIASYDVQAAGGQLNSRWVDDEGDVFLQPLHVLGEVMFHVRRDGDKPGVVVAAIQMDSRQRYWETRLAPPPAAGAILDPERRQAVVLLTSGKLFQAPIKDLLANPRFAVAGGPVEVKDAAPGDTTLNLVETHVVHFAGGKLVFASASQPRRVLVYEPGGTGSVLRWVNLPDPAGGPPAALGEQLLVPSAVGQVFAMQPFTEKFTLDPYQPHLESGRQHQWQVALPAVADDAVFADTSKLYRFSARSQPREHVAALNEAALRQPLSTSLARLNQSAYALNAVGELVAFALPELRTVQTWKVRGERVWGPGRVGQHALFVYEPEPYEELHLTGGQVIKTKPLHVTAPKQPRPEEKLTYEPWDLPSAAAEKKDTEKKGTEKKETKKKGKATAKTKTPATVFQVAWSQIARIRRYDEIVAEQGAHRVMCLDDQRRVVWEVSLKAPAVDREARIASAPLAVGDGFLLASEKGVIWKLASDGRELAKLDLAQPLAFGPALLDERHVLLTGADAALHVLEVP